MSVAVNRFLSFFSPKISSDASQNFNEFLSRAYHLHITMIKRNKSRDKDSLPDWVSL